MNGISLQVDAIFISELQIIPSILPHKRPFEGDIIFLNCPKRSFKTKYLSNVVATKIIENLNTRVCIAISEFFGTNEDARDCSTASIPNMREI
jgi:hypothetical protein